MYDLFLYNQVVHMFKAVYFCMISNAFFLLQIIEFHVCVEGIGYAIIVTVC